MPTTNLKKKQGCQSTCRGISRRDAPGRKEKLPDDVGEVYYIL